ncbi:MAG: lipopolysaccharide heptosyltransferase II [Sedimentisphaerales bacterium]|nr:lipopolysaccharide heptosyltransferase II [Sedimentisphaerales bacterium]
MKPSALGDIVLALPALASLRKSFPNAKISWLVKPEFASLLENHPYLDEIIIFDRKHLSKALSNTKAFGSLHSLIAQLRQEKFDAIFDFQGLFRTAFMSWLSGSKKRYGIANAREMAHLFYTDKIEHNLDCIHLVDLYLKMVQAAGAKNEKAEFVIPSNQTDVDSVKKLLKNHNIEPNKYIVFIPGSAQESKCWPAERFAQLADKFSAQYNYPIIAIGSKSEKSKAQEIITLAKTEIINLAGQTSLKELVELLRMAKLVVSNDTGPGHIASALGMPLVIMYSWSNPARIAPYGRDECMVARDPYSRGMEIKSNNPNHSITNITVEEVFQKASEQLNKSTAK